ncbi:hypothetical protein [Polymorphospora sp. NPDC050346]|uniref:hypothetical protein n=1 Tax=Polymorphospora sp. NPDC050346 TaxID=3155780 RepID=UPI0033F1313B
MILPTLVAQVLRNVSGDLVDVQPVAIRGQRIPPPERTPAIRVRPKKVPWIDGGRMIGRLLVLSISHGDPLIVDPFALVNRRTGYVLDEHMTGMPGVSMQIRCADPTRSTSARTAQCWSVIAALANA